MLIVLSPAKTLDLAKQTITKKSSKPMLLEDSESLIRALRRLSVKQLGKLMGISQDLAKATHQQYLDWSPPFSRSNAKQAVLTFRGNAYLGLNADAYTAADFDNAQTSLRILSGLYGVLRPLDLIQPYRLEMGTKIKPPRGKNLYEFWGTRITDLLNKDLSRCEQRVMVNLASNEYFKAIAPKQLDARIVTPNFREARNGTYKSIGTFAKKARGLMASYIIRNRLSDVDDIRSFDVEDYRFDAGQSSGDHWIFIRD